MTKPYLELTCDLPLDLITQSPGFSFDIGTSVAKFVIRPKDEFTQGVPKEKKEGQTMGTLLLVSLPRNDTHLFAEYIRDKCDLSDNKGQPLDIAVTGVGSQTFKHTIEKELNIKLRVKTEYDCFIDAFVLTSKILSPEQLYHPLSPEYLEKARKIALMLLHMAGDWNVSDHVPGSQNDPVPTVAKKPEFPCILTTSGSAMDIKLDFKEIIRMIESTDGRTVDAYTTEVVDSSGEGDLYSEMPEIRMFPFGKAVTADKDSLKTEDMVHSILESQCEVFAQMTHSTALLQGVKGVYFSGSLITAKRVRDWVTQYFWIRNFSLPLDKRIDLQFLKHGSHLGALGAFIKGATED